MVSVKLNNVVTVQKKLIPKLVDSALACLQHVLSSVKNEEDMQKLNQDFLNFKDALANGKPHEEFLSNFRIEMQKKRDILNSLAAQIFSKLPNKVSLNEHFKKAFIYCKDEYQDAICEALQNRSQSILTNVDALFYSQPLFQDDASASDACARSGGAGVPTRLLSPEDEVIRNIKIFFAHFSIMLSNSIKLKKGELKREEFGDATDLIENVLKWVYLLLTSKNSEHSNINRVQIEQFNNKQLGELISKLEKLDLTDDRLATIGHLQHFLKLDDKQKYIESMKIAVFRWWAESLHKTDISSYEKFREIFGKITNSYLLNKDTDIYLLFQRQNQKLMNASRVKKYVKNEYLTRVPSNNGEYNYTLAIDEKTYIIGSKTRQTIFRLNKVNIGRGGFGTVFLYNCKIENPAVKKVMHKSDLELDMDSFQHVTLSIFRRNLQTFFIPFVPIKRTDDGKLIGIMPFVKGNTEFQPGMVKISHIQAHAQALQSAHSEDLLFLDYKPSNLILNEKTDTLFRIDTDGEGSGKVPMTKEFSPPYWTTKGREFFSLVEKLFTVHDLKTYRKIVCLFEYALTARILLSKNTKDMRNITALTNDLTTEGRQILLSKILEIIEPEHQIHVYALFSFIINFDKNPVIMRIIYSSICGISYKSLFNPRY